MKQPSRRSRTIVFLSRALDLARTETVDGAGADEKPQLALQDENCFTLSRSWKRVYNS
jgi:hypothetical protein